MSNVINATGRELSSNNGGTNTSRTISSGPSAVYYSPDTRAINEYSGGYNGVQDYLSLYDKNNSRYDQIAAKYNNLNKLSNRDYNKMLFSFINDQRNYNYNLMNTVNKYNDSAYQRLVNDLKKAGLNPLLATYNVSANRLTSIPYSTNVPNFSEFKYEKPETDKNNYLSDMYNLLINFMNNATKKELSELEYVHNLNLQNKDHFNKLEQDYNKYLYDQKLTDSENSWRAFLQHEKYVYDKDLQRSEHEQQSYLQYKDYEYKKDFTEYVKKIASTDAEISAMANIVGHLISAGATVYKFVN